MNTYNKYIACSDSFKGCLSSQDVNAAIARGLTANGEEVCVDSVLMSDGGEGFLDAVADRRGGIRRQVQVHDPLMRPICADYLTLPDGTVVIECARVCGIMLLKPDELNPLQATTYGLGELLSVVFRAGARRIVIGLGGTCTNDFGMGMLNALMIHLAPHGDVRDLQRMWAECEVVLATDVDNVLLGSQGATSSFAAQKGATPEMMKTLERRGEAVVQRYSHLMPRDCSSIPGAGAAGGLGYALMQFLNARPQSGIDLLLDWADFRQMIDKDTCIITGEGSADAQTVHGKVPYGILRCAKTAGADVYLLAGKVKDAQLLRNAGFRDIIDINADYADDGTALRPDVASERIAKAAYRCRKRISLMPCLPMKRLLST